MEGKNAIQKQRYNTPRYHPEEPATRLNKKMMKGYEFPYYGLTVRETERRLKQELKGYEDKTANMINNMNVVAWRYVRDMRGVDEKYDEKYNYFESLMNVEFVTENALPMTAVKYDRKSGKITPYGNVNSHDEDLAYIRLYLKGLVPYDHKHRKDLESIGM